MSQLTQAASSKSSGNVDVIESFFGVYLLYSLNPNPRYRGRTYIGYTVNPNRRITQHNKGSSYGGARRTNNRGPWEMVLIVHGFPNDISALRFEWAWQHPMRSRRLKNIGRKKLRENHYQHQLRIMLEMLRMGPWNKLPLTVRWLAEQYQQHFQADMCPPMHMPVTMGTVCAKKLTKEPVIIATETTQCSLCNQALAGEDAVSCVVPRCICVAHLTCLAKLFTNNTDDILPVEGSCPCCHTQVLWGDLIRKKKGCFKELSESIL